MRPIVLVAVLSSSFTLAQTPAVKAPNPDSLPWAERASFFVGPRAGIAMPPGATGIAANAGIDFGLAVPQGFGFSMRVMWMDKPPGAPLLGIRDTEYGFGALADLRYYFRAIEPLSIYPTLGIGFLVGPDRATGTNTVLPLFNPGVGMKVKAGNFYGTFDIGLSGFTIPFVGLSVGFEGDSIVTKREKERAAEVPAPAPNPDTAAPSLLPVPPPPAS